MPTGSTFDSDCQKYANGSFYDSIAAMDKLAPTPATLPAELLAAWLELLPEPHIVFDRNYRIVAANSAYRHQFGQGAQVLGRSCHAVSHHSAVPCDQAGEDCPLLRATHSGQREKVLHLHHTPAGEAYVQIELVALPGPDGKPSLFLEKMEPLRIAHSQAGTQGMIGRAPAFKALLERIARVAPSQASVLLLGESGTGKELAARAVHESSPRAARPLVVVDCASLPESLFESELFGHERGAFTGAHAARAGLVEAAHGGTLFLDEVGDIALTMQVKLLRLLESGTYRRVGQSELRRADIRLVAATHRDLQAMVRQGQFRQDLYYRLSTFPIHLPALRERVQDIPLLAEALLTRLAPGRPLQLSPPALQRLLQHPFAGNVRELRNILERSILLSDGDRIEAQAVEQALTLDQLPAPAALPTSAAALPTGSSSEAQLRTLLTSTAGTREQQARALGMSTRTLYRKLRQLQAPPPQPPLADQVKRSPST